MLNRIREAREQANMKQKELAERIGTSSTNLSRYENGKRDIPIQMAIDIAKALHMSVESLFTSSP